MSVFYSGTKNLILDKQILDGFVVFFFMCIALCIFVVLFYVDLLIFLRSLFSVGTMDDI